MSALVSIVLPTYRQGKFLEERLGSIFAQTHGDWELIVVDGFSDDGSWELVRELSKKDTRVRAFQQQPDGPYAAINYGIELARGDYIYIATADDSMQPQCLEKMLFALREYPECGICHCALDIVDEEGVLQQDAWRKYPAPAFLGELLDVSHVRKAPLDSILHCALFTVYTSLTQLLIRRDVFEQAGVFSSRWGAIGDFEWGMRASAVTNTLFIPEALATWRRHSEQLTEEGAFYSLNYRPKLLEMINAALPKLVEYNSASISGLDLTKLEFVYRRQQKYLQWSSKLSSLLSFGKPTTEEAPSFNSGGRLLRRDIKYIAREIDRLGMQEHIHVV